VDKRERKVCFISLRKYVGKGIPPSFRRVEFQSFRIWKGGVGKKRLVN
jgi:hypothetical protein